jgi:predicted HicB family RNase H-like nuclease
MKQLKKLTEIESIHEQREDIGGNATIEKGVWIEISDFEPETEQVQIFHRWKVIEIKKETIKNKKHYTITCKKLNVEKEKNIKKEIANKIIEKHNNILKASFTKCLIEGIDSQTTNSLKRILYKLGGEGDVKQKNN